MNKLILYENTKITPQRNAKVDGIDLYLEEVPSITLDIQKLKTDLDLTVKVNLNQDEINKARYNYAEYREGDEGNVRYYFFILDMTWTAQSTVSLQLSMDTINTFWDKLIWDEKTLTIREHRDRFMTNLVNTDGFTAVRKIDYQSEGFSGLPMERISDVVLRDEEGLDTDWHIVYNSEADAKPLKAYIMPEKPIPVKGGAATTNVEWNANAISRSDYYYFTVEDNGAGADKNITLYNPTSVWSLQDTATGPYRVIRLRRDEKFLYIARLWYDENNNYLKETETGRTYDENTIIYLNNLIAFHVSTIASTDYATINNMPEKTFTSDTSLSLFGKLDRTLSTLNSIILMPYLPVDVEKDTAGNYVSSYLSVFADQDLVYWKINDISNNYKYFNHVIDDGISTAEWKVQIPNKTIRDLAHKNAIYESKLFHSDFYQKKLMYDKDSLLIRWEQFQPKTNFADAIPDSLWVNFKMSPAISSSFMFRVDYKTKIWANRTYTEDYPDVLISNRNNQEMIYSSDYLNYIRVGYNYDRADRDWNIGATWTNTGLSVAGAATGAFLGTRGLGTGGIIGLAASSQITGAVSQISNAIISTAQANRNLDRKLAEAKASAVNVAGLSDVDFMREYCGNRLHVMTYDLVPQIKSKLLDLFHYTGYGVEIQKIPNFEGRRYFNFVQCEPVFVNENSEVLNKYVADISDRCAKGITIYHRYEFKYDWDQDYENWESWID